MFSFFTIAGNDYTLGNQFSFAGSQAYALDSIELAAGLVTGANQLNVSLMTDAGGVPGSVLESFSFTDEMGRFGFNVGILTGTSVSHTQLESDTNYWFVASVPEGTSAAWSRSLPEVYGPHVFHFDGGVWGPANNGVQGAFRINGTPVAVPVPVPGAALLATLGLSSTGWFLRRRRA